MKPWFVALVAVCLLAASGARGEEPKYVDAATVPEPTFVGGNVERVAQAVVKTALKDAHEDADMKAAIDKHLNAALQEKLATGEVPANVAEANEAEDLAALAERQVEAVEAEAAAIENPNAKPSKCLDNGAEPPPGMKLTSNTMTVIAPSQSYTAGACDRQCSKCKCSHKPRPKKPKCHEVLHGPPKPCPANCSGHGECRPDGTCVCYMGFRGKSCCEVCPADDPCD